MKLSAVVVTESEELFLLNTFVTVLAASPSDTPLFLVGDWPRSKMFSKVSYHFELVCFRKDFDRTRSLLTASLASPEAGRFFKDHIPPNTPHQPHTRAHSGLSLTIRLFTHNGNKYKVSLDCVRNDNLLADLASRDFSINALYCDLQTKKLVAQQDFFSDFERKIIRAIRPPEQTFGHHVNLFFRFIEFMVRYDLEVHPDIAAYFKSIDPARDIFQAAVDLQPNNLYSSAKKFFSKHYVGQMFAVMDRLGLLSFFQLDFRDPPRFCRSFVKVLPYLELLEPMLKMAMPPELAEIYPDGVPKVFFTKARIFLIAQVMNRTDPFYSQTFLKMFLYNGKDVSKELCQVMDELNRLLDTPVEDLAQGNEGRVYTRLRQVLDSVSVDKSQWAFLLVFQVLRKVRVEQLKDYRVYTVPGHL